MSRPAWCKVNVSVVEGEELKTAWLKTMSSKTCAPRTWSFGCETGSKSGRVLANYCVVETAGRSMGSLLPVLSHWYSDLMVDDFEVQKDYWYTNLIKRERVDLSHDLCKRTEEVGPLLLHSSQTQVSKSELGFWLHPIVVLVKSDAIRALSWKSFHYDEGVSERVVEVS